MRQQLCDVDETQLETLDCGVLEIYFTHAALVLNCRSFVTPMSIFLIIAVSIWVNLLSRTLGDILTADGKQPILGLRKGSFLRHATILNLRGGENGDEWSNRPDKELVLGKDRELVHFSVDLKWVWSKMTNKLTYIDFMRSSWKGIRYLAGLEDSDKLFKEIAVDMLQHIRSINDESSLKLFQGNIKLAEWLSMNTGRLILIYIEDGSAKSPTSNSIQYRIALSDSLLGKFINQEVHTCMTSLSSSMSRSPLINPLSILTVLQFIFYAGTTQHKLTRQMSSSLLSDKEYPLLAVLAPRSNAKDSAPQLLAVQRLAPDDITVANVSEFLQR